MASNESRRRSVAQCRTAVIEPLLEDHQRVRKLFKQFRMLDPEAQPQECEGIVRTACIELTIHAQLEAEMLYPAARGHIDTPMLVDEAQVEHASAKDLIAQLVAASAADALYAAKFTVLGEHVEHHILEEEKLLFPELMRSGIDWERLADGMEERRAELMEELMPEGQDEPPRRVRAAGAMRAPAPARHR